MITEELKVRIFSSEKFLALKKAVANLRAGRKLVLQGAHGSLLGFIAAHVFEEHAGQVLIVASSGEKGEKLRDDCELLLGESNVCYFGARPTHKAQSLDVSSSVAQAQTLNTLSSHTKVLVVASPQSISEKVPPGENFRRAVIELHINSQHDFQQLIGRLKELGFEKKDFVEGYGDVAVRGGIVDVYPYVGENPVRIEFWGDTIESIREFDVLSQRSIRELRTATIIPNFSADGFGVTDDQHGITGADRSLPVSLFEYLQQNAIVILDEPTLIQREVDELSAEGVTELFSFEETLERAVGFPLIVNSLFGEYQSLEQIPQEHGNWDFRAHPQPSFNGSVNALVDYVEKLSLEGYQTTLTCDTVEEVNRLRELIDEVPSVPEGDTQEVSSSALSKRKLNFKILHGTVHSGFVYHPERIALLTEHEIFGRLRRRGTSKRHRFRGITQKELQQLKRGDYVVHVDHGIGVFEGLKKISVAGVEQEVMRLLFLEDDVLYVNLNFMNRVQKYSSQEGHVPKLNKLGGSEWERAKERAKKRIKDIARDIIALYARRKHEKGFPFSPDTHWQKELEASFMYEDTTDQARATLDVKQDMENPAPMDRLICGDVGFGKTEVAVRAAFKAVMDGKQVAVLVPTTILAIQHHNTFHDRLGRYTTRIEHITRFKSPKEQKKIVAALLQGSVDIIIGTHRLLSTDIAFKDLGLLIIDEEHRFGVSAKEKLRKLKASVDTLALTATPIPRTLHFSLIGARDLSLISTPPRNRLPIVTEIIPFDDRGKQHHWNIVREALVRELHRGGQAYFVHDRVQTIEAIADQVKRQVPEARVHVAHGQMSGHELEKTMLSFLEKKYDVLVCTKIIESGLDIPNVNTIIINRADMFGLAELYQLRGRVGRSNVQAYAYLLVPPLSVVPRQTLRRLQAIEEFAELGSGFNLAMRDLEIRGAGNLLGAEQSGFILEMGFEMYERIVREAVEELRMAEFKEVFRPPPLSPHRSVDTVIDADIDALIPDFYVDSDTERLDVYRRLYQASSREELSSLRSELRDRFGEYPEETENLFQLVELRLVASTGGFAKILLRGDSLSITLPPSSDEAFYGISENGTSPFQELLATISAPTRKNLKFKQEGKELSVQIGLQPTDSVVRKLDEAAKNLKEFNEIFHSATKGKETA